MVSNMALNFIFVGVLLAFAFQGPHTGLALASSVAAYINAGLLFRSLRKQGTYKPEPGWSRLGLAVLAGCIAMVAVITWQYGEISQWVEAPGFSRAVRLTLLIGLGVVVYGAAIIAGGLRTHHLAKGSS